MVSRLAHHRSAFVADAPPDHPCTEGTSDAPLREPDRARDRWDRRPGLEPRARLSRGGSERGDRRHRRGTRRRSRRRARDPRSLRPPRRHRRELVVRRRASRRERLRRPERARQQRRGPEPAGADREHGPGHVVAHPRHQPHRDLPRHQGRRPRSAPRSRGSHRQHRLDHGPGRHGSLRAVRRQQVGRARPHPNGSTRARPRPHPGEHHPPRRDLDPFIHEPAAGATAAIADFYSPEPFAIPRLGEPTDVSGLLLFLTSSDASFITGSEYVIDGGLLLGPALQAETA
jgi:hypothetical protein